jgi:hypothetical protein
VLGTTLPGPTRSFRVWAGEFFDEEAVDGERCRRTAAASLRTFPDSDLTAYRPPQRQARGHRARDGVLEKGAPAQNQDDLIVLPITLVLRRLSPPATPPARRR